MKNSLYILFLSTFLVACFKEEIPVPAHDSGDAIELVVGIGQDYRNQLFYRLRDNQIVSSNNKSDWDLAFESSADGKHIILNTSKGMKVHRSDLDFEDITTSDGLSWNWDVQSGNLDSTAFGDWQTDHKLYIVDLGYDHAGDHQGTVKLKMSGWSGTEYQIEYGDIADLSSQSVTITKNTDNLFTYFKFGVGVLTIAPKNEDWDLMFTQYTHLFTDPVEAYVVTGVLLNRFNTTASRITDKPFSEVEYDDVTGLTYYANIDYIGYNWKFYDYDNAVYIVDPTVTYIVKSNDGYYYKFHFVDFYNESGEKGHPKLEVQQL